MVLPLKKAVDSLFKTCGTKGTYQGHEVLFLLTEPDEVIGVGFANAHTDTHQMRMRRSDAPDLAVGAIIENGTTVFKVHSEPRLDSHQLVWSIDVLCN